MGTQIDVAGWTAFEVDSDGNHVRIQFRDSSDSPASLVLPAACLNQLLMCLPLMAQTALRNRYGDDSLRLVHPLGRYSIEPGTPNYQGVEQFILTLNTGGGYSVAFAMPGGMLTQIAQSISEEVIPDRTVQLHHHN